MDSARESGGEGDREGVRGRPPHLAERGQHGAVKGCGVLWTLVKGYDVCKLLQLGAFFNCPWLKKEGGFDLVVVGSSLFF